MKRLLPSTFVHGTVAGVAAGLVVALWFLVLDVATTEVFHTPAVLASAILGNPVTAPTFRLVAVYTVLHFAVFALLGVAVASFIQSVELSPGLLLGAAFGLGVLTSVHYGALLATGADVLGVLPAPHVLAANLLGGLVMILYLHRALHSTVPIGPPESFRQRWLAEGLVTGLVGAAAVALWFLLLDTIMGRPFFTPAALGSVVLFGAEGPSDVRVNLGLIAAYSVLHLAAFAVVGIALVWASERLERSPSLWLVSLLAFIIIEGLFIGTLGSLSTWVLGTVGIWAIAVGNLLAIAAMGAYVWRRHPGLASKLVGADVRV